MEKARRDLMDADEKLAVKRADEKRNRAIMDAKWEDLRTKEILLKESFISFNKVRIKYKKMLFVSANIIFYVWQTLGLINCQ